MKGKKLILKNKNKNLKEITKKIVIYALLVIIVVVVGLPLFYAISTSFEGAKRVVPNLVSIFPQKFSFKNYIFALDHIKLEKNMLNSFFVSTVTSFVTTIIVCFAAYSLSRQQSRIHKASSVLILVTQLMPPALLVIPLYVVWRSFGLINNLLTLIITYLSFTLPFGTLILKNFFDTIDPDLEGAAQIDGCSKTGALLRVILPVSLPGIAVILIFSFILCWNEFLYASIFISSSNIQTLPPKVVEMYATFNQFTQGQILTVLVIPAIPAILLVIIASRYLVGGLTLGSIKG